MFTSRLRKNCHRLGADQHDLRGHAGVRVPPEFAEKVPEQVDVQAAAQPAVGGNEDVAGGLLLALGQVRRRVVRPGMVEVACDLAYAVGIGAGRGHPLLGAADLAGRDHFHGARDLLRVLHAADLAADFLCARHCSLYRFSSFPASPALLRALGIVADGSPGVCIPLAGALEQGQRESSQGWRLPREEYR